LKLLGITGNSWGLPFAPEDLTLFATRLFNCGLTLKEIGDLLGHRKVDSTRIYAKIDLPHLRQVADLDLRELR
jgi:site-specific recombinase XerC